MEVSQIQVISANDLFNGNVVYLDANGGWAADLSEAMLIYDKNEAEAFLQGAKAQPEKVVDPYLLEVAVGCHGVAPTHIRERLRVSGPSFWVNLQRTPLPPLS